MYSIRQFYMKRAARFIRFAEGLGQVCHVNNRSNLFWFVLVEWDRRSQSNELLEEL